MKPRMTMKARVVIGMSMALALSACSHDKSVTAQDRAEKMCTDALHHRPFNAAPTTVAEVRSVSVGAGFHPAANALFGRNAQDLAAWCWDDLGGGSYKSVAVGPNNETVTFGTVNGSASFPPPPGPPGFP